MTILNPPAKTPTAPCIILVATLVLFGTCRLAAADDLPRALDDRLTVERFAEAPQIVHPVGMTFDAKGRLLVVESHTHFRPDHYQGPPRDRVQVLEDTDGDGKADRIGTFFEGTRFTMDIAAHPDGSIYLATRYEVLRLRDADGDGRSDESRRVVVLDTKGDYPHNGLSGLSFDSEGNLTFGMGENLGAAYTLKGSDGVEISGGGEGGGVFVCSPEGKDLRRMATGFWNPFGTCRDIYGRLFAVDNDPDSMPPCRLVHVVEGGDYGYQFRYGRSGRHVFQSWNGELPGTLPIVSGTGEAPCEIVSYESDGLPGDYLGSLLVTAWADHRLERHVPRPRGSSFAAEMQTMVRGGKDFRPTGLAVAPDGSLFVGDWVLKDYTLHGKGAIWHVRAKEPFRRERPADPKYALLSMHRPVREEAATRLAAWEDGREFLRQRLRGENPRVRAASLSALVDAGDHRVDLSAIVANDDEIGIRAMAARALVNQGRDAARWLAADTPAEVRREGIGSFDNNDAPRVLALLGDADPFIRAAAVHRVAQLGLTLEKIDRSGMSPLQRAGVLLADRATAGPSDSHRVAEYLSDRDEDVRLLAVKWVADQALAAYRPQIVKALEDRDVTVRMASALSTALARIDGQDVSEAKMAEAALGRLRDETGPPALRVVAIQLLPASQRGLTVDLLAKLIAAADPRLRLEAARALCEHPSTRRFPVLLATARDESLGMAVRAQAVDGLAEHADSRDELLRMALGDDAPLRDEGLRTLVGAQLSPDQRKTLESLAGRVPGSAPLVERVLGKPFVHDRPRPEDVDAWLLKLDGPADPEAGRRVFFHAKLAGCYRCHRAEGRGRDVGPDLSVIGRTGRRRIVESILQPSNEIGPSYQSWQIATNDGRVLSGILVRTNLDETTYLDASGSLFTVTTPDVAERRPLSTSIMPAGLADLLTDQELRDLVAYLDSRR